VKFIIKIFILLAPLIFVSAVIDNNTGDITHKKKLLSPIELVNSNWVDSLMNTMTIEEKISQLFMISVYSGKGDGYEKKLIKQIKNIQPGGIILMKGEPYAQTELTNRLQTLSKIPLMVAIDGEWGMAMRIDSVISFPKAMALGAVQDDQLIYDLGYEIAEQCKRMGIHINFAPVVDINNRYNNPIINIRAFGDNKYNVARKGLAYSIGMQSNGVLAVGKHFPGHGSTTTDSHKTLPTINFTKEHLYNNELYPFKSLINNELGGIMVGHIAVPSLDNRPNRPASLSANVVDTILKQQLGFKGLIFTDALNMKGVTRDYKPGQIEVEALLAGNDVLLYPEDLEIAIKSIVGAIKKGILTEEMINEKCTKILKVKKWFGLDNYKSSNLKNIVQDLNSISSKKIKQQLVESSITLIRNRDSLLPFNNLEKKRILCVSMGKRTSNIFEKYLNKYTKVDTISCSNMPTQQVVNKIMDTLSYYTDVVVAQHGASQWPSKHFKLTDANIRLAERIAKEKPTVLSFFGNAYALRYYSNLYNFSSIIIGYSNDTLYKKYVAQAIFGGIGVEGMLPISINSKFHSGIGLFYDAIRLKYTEPYEFGLLDNAFYKVDSIVESAIRMKAIPGCQIIYAKDGKVVYDKNFGYHTYKKKERVKSDDIYDIASVTKIVATTVSLMQMYENNEIDVKDKLSDYLTELKQTDKKKLHINEILSHQSGLHPWIPFYKKTLDKAGNLRSDLYSKDSTSEFSIKVSPHIYLRNDYIDTIYQTIIDTAIYDKKKYKYSDLGFYWMAKLIKQYAGEPIDEYTQKHYYRPLGMNSTMYNPWRFSNLSLVPSEDDEIYRKQIIKGYVNDQGAAMLGGVSGHAGVFSNTTDLIKMGQLLLNKGYYGGANYFKSSTLDVFNKSYYKKNDNRRALGFDKPKLHKDDVGPTCESASNKSFGHTGFTGAFMWIEPLNNSVYIFLSNRTFPNSQNVKLVKMNIRTDIQQVFYDVFSK
jgi:beta-glucosidase-like glycosyl hydrolase/CubicO group peptidase (beta-lactamase class C family)